MPVVTMSASSPIQSPANTIYNVLADYTNHHQQILPRKYFRTVVVEEGGIGAGTVFRADMEVYGSKSSFHMTVSEPQPGRVIQETDMDSTLFTTFSVEPTGSDGAMVTIASQWERPAGFTSWLESSVRVWIMKRIYQEELAQLAQYMTTIKQ